MATEDITGQEVKASKRSLQNQEVDKSAKLGRMYEKKGLTGYERHSLKNQNIKENKLVRGLVHVGSIIGAGVFTAALGRCVYLNFKDVAAKEEYNKAIMENTYLIDTNNRNGIEPEELGRFHYKISKGKEDITLGKGKDYWPMRNGKRVPIQEVTEWIREHDSTR